MDDKNFEYIFHYEYLDYKSSLGKIYTKDLYEFLRTKYSNNPYDALIAVDNNSLDFLLSYREDVFTDVPKVFCGINNFELVNLSGIDNISGVSQEEGIEKTISLIKKIHPNKKKILFILDYLLTSKYIRAKIQTIEPKFKNQFEFEYFTFESIDGLRKKLESLGEEYLVYMSVVNMDSNGVYYSDGEGARLCSEYSKVPIYGNYAEFVGNGVIGGYISQGYYQGFEAGKMLQRVFKGEDINRINVHFGTAHKSLFDYKQLQRFDIDLDQLPANAEVINIPKKLTEKFSLITIILSIVTVLITTLSIIIYKFQRSNTQKLKVSNQELKLIIGKKSKEVLKSIKEIEMMFNCKAVAIMKIENERIVKCNQRACEIFGYEMNKFVGLHTTDLHLSSVFHDEFFNTLEATEDRSTSRFEYPFMKQNGEEVWLAGSGSIFSESEAVWFFDDITKKKQIEQVKEDVERMMRHDLRTPLNGIVGFTKLLKKSENLSYDDIEKLDKIDNCTQNILKLINNSIDLYKLETNTYEPLEKEFNLLELVNQTFEDLKSIYKQKHLKPIIAYNFKETNKTDKLIINTDYLLMYSIITNLIKNAVEASPENHEITINIEDKNFLTLSIHNYGAVPSIIRKNFFEKYSTSGKFNGTGLGTYSAKLMCEVIDGKISMRTNKDSGTVVMMEFENIHCFSTTKYNVEDY
jgi:PAS domain S-box-containing protein